MSYGKLNIWLRFEDCSLIDSCWRTDLVIKTCSGKYLVDMFPSIITDLQKKYPDLDISENKNYYGSNRIKIQPKRGGLLKPHLELDVPPGCYVVWTRICYTGNEETNKVIVAVSCGHEACVNLLLNSTETCARELLHPAIALAKELDLPEKEIKIAADLLTRLAKIEPEHLKKDIKNRIAELSEHKAGRPEMKFHLQGLNLLKK